MLCKTFGRMKAPPGLSLLTQTRTQLLLFSDPPRRWFYFDYDPGPLFCVHLQKIHVPGASKRLAAARRSMFFFIIAPQKNGVNPKPWIYRNFILPKHKFHFASKGSAPKPAGFCRDAFLQERRSDTLHFCTKQNTLFSVAAH